jgi:glycosyltransferase involved in cell wall biosynthesis
MTPDVPLVSIITPVYNGSKYLDELIQSVRAQDYPNIEHIVIDDGSTDEGATAAILRRYPHLRSWSRGNLGQYATMNEGLAAAKGEYVCFISADDVMEPGAVRRVFDFFREHPEFDGVIGCTRAMTEAGNPYAAPPFQFVPVRSYAYFMQISHCSLYVNREALLRRRLTFDPSLRYIGDYDWLVRVVDTLRIGRLHFPLSTVRIHRTQASRLHRQVMMAEQRRIVTANRIHPWLFTASRYAYILVHDLAKLYFAIKNGGIAGGARLFINRFWTGPSEGPRRRR